jgi:hypothetical protein
LKLKYIEYLGIENPETEVEIQVEITGLKHAISQAEELICRLEQALMIAKLEDSNEGNSR